MYTDHEYSDGEVTPVQEPEGPTRQVSVAVLECERDHSVPQDIKEYWPVVTLFDHAS